MNTVTDAEIKVYMESSISENTDPKTDEINRTGLAEDACAHFDLYENGDIPEYLFDLADQVASQQERRQNFWTSYTGAN